MQITPAPVTRHRFAAFGTAILLMFIILSSPTAGGAGVPASVAAEKQAATLELGFADDSESRKTFGGFFISPEGLALCDLGAFARKEKPDRIVAGQGHKLPFPEILALFPIQRLALVRFAHQPEAFLEIATDQPDLGTTVAVLARGSDKAVLEGPVLASTSALTPDYRKPEFRKILSLGAGLPITWGPAGNPLREGAAVINAEGKAVASFLATVRKGSQLKLHAAPLDTLPPLIKAACDQPQPVPFPIPDELNPFEPSSLSPLKAAIVAAMSRKDEKQLQQELAAIKTQFPDSQAVRWLEYESHRLLQPDDQLPKMAAALKPPPGSGDAEMSAFQIALGQALQLSGDLDGAILEFKRAIRISPPDHALPRAMLASALARKGRPKEAENLYWQAHFASPDDIRILEGLRKVLSRSGKPREMADIADRIYYLEDLYRRR